MALSALAKKIVRFHELHAEHKAREKELDELKAFFKAEAGDVDAVFQHKDLEVPVTWKERAGGWDAVKLEAELGDKAQAFKKAATRYAEVSCRKGAA